MHGDTIVYTYKGFTYQPEDEVEEDNVKRFHGVYINGNYIYGGSIPMSPYGYITKQMFERWIDMDRPTQRDMDGRTNGHHEEYYQKWVVKQLEKEFDL